MLAVLLINGFSAVGCMNRHAGADAEMPSEVVATNDDEISQKAFNLINAERTKEGLPALKFNSSCQLAAQAHSEDMLARGFFAHDSPTETFQQRMIRMGLDKASVGENIAYFETPEEAVAMWMGSVGHRSNIMNVLFVSSGVGFSKGLFTQCFYGK